MEIATHQAGKLLRIVVSWAQYCIGTSTPVLQDVTTSWPHFESKWLNSLRNYLRDIGGHLRLTQTGVPKLQRINDMFVMDIALNSKIFGPSALRRINYCRMYLNVLFLSDITSPNGKCIDKAAYVGDRQALQSYEVGDSIHQAKPNEKAWTEWQKCLQLLCHRNRSHTLKEPLGAWIVPPHEYARDWALLYSATEDAVYSSNDIDYSVHRRIRRDFDKDTDEYTTNLPTDAVPIEVRETQHTWISPGHITPQDMIPPDTNVVTKFPHTVDNMHPWERHLLLDITFLKPEEDIWSYLCQGQCFAASDGSAPKGKGSFAWVLSNATGERMARCSGPVFGYSISSYRAESYGMLSFLRFLLHMVGIHGPPGQQLTPPHLVCDNLGLVTTVSRILTYPHIFPNTTMEPEWDCIAQILATMNHLDAQAPTIAHIKGHQDERTPYEELSLLAQLNCDADTFANVFLQQHPCINHMIVHQFPAGECVLQLKAGTVTRDYKYECSLARTLPAYRTYVTKKNQWYNESVFDNVDWTAHGQALQRHEKQRPTFTKLLHKILPLGHQVHKYDPKYPSNCPTCHYEKEDMDHFWTCQSASRVAWRKQFLTELRQKLIELGTGTEIRNLLLSKIKAVLEGENPNRVPEDPTLVELCAKQKEIHWDQLLLGRFATDWNTHARTQPGIKKKHQVTWTTDVIDFIFSQWWKLWESRNQDRHGRDLATKQQAHARQVERELEMFYDHYEEQAPQHLKWIFDVTIDVRRQWTTYATRQWLNTWAPILSNATNPAAAPTNPENYPYTTALETG